MALSPVPTRHAPTRDLHALENEITELSAHLSAATYRLLTLLREFDQRHGWSGAGVNSCAHWLNWKCGIALGAAREKLRVAHALEDLPQISAAFRAGRVSFSKVRAMTRVATPQNEDYLLYIADHGTAAHVERLVRGYRRVKRNEALRRDNERHELRELRWYVDDDGCCVIRGRLGPEQAAHVVKALEAALETDREERRDVPEGVSAETPVAARRADALERIAMAYLAGDKCCAGGGDRYTVHIHTDVATLQEDGEGAEAELESGGGVCAETARRMACDCGVVHWLDNSEGTALDVGRRTRSIPPALRRALARRDGGCRFPGCTTHHHVDAHHIRHWADGGETRLDNLLLLCRHHHRLVHEGGFGVAWGGAAGPVFRQPDGTQIAPGPDSRSRGNVYALKTWNRRRGVEIGPRTPLPRWSGENMDDTMAVDGLLRRE